MKSESVITELLKNMTPWNAIKLAFSYMVFEIVRLVLGISALVAIGSLLYWIFK